jgi:branched-chain amino acid transport system permease protein
VTELAQNVVDAVSLGSLYALFALGIALIFGVMKLINFAHGDLIAVAAYTLFYLLGLPWLLLVPLTLGTAVVLALAMDRVAFRPVRGADPATLLVTSFAVSVLIHNALLLTVGARPKGVTLPAFLGEATTLFGLRVQKLSFVIVAVTASLLAALAVFLKKTLIGVQMRAAAEDFEAARLLGVRANRVIAVAFALSGLLGGIASILLVSQTGTLRPAMGLTPVLIAFLATVIGGMGSLTGAVFGGFLLGALTVALQTVLPLELREYRDAFAFSIVVLILLFRPQGLFVSRLATPRV